VAENTKIEWADHTWNPWIGCTEVSPACDHCYARVLMQDRHKRAVWGPGQERVRTAPANWDLPFRWDRKAAKAGTPATVFCLSLGDIWDNEVDAYTRREVFTTIEHTPNLIWLLLSKRIGNARKIVQEQLNRHWLPGNVMLGATVVNQQEWDRDIPKLEATAYDLSDPKAPIKTFASMEPLLERVILRGTSIPDWIIVGGESGPGWRDLPLEWAYDLASQTAAADRKFFFKQAAGRRPIPENLMIREFVHK